MKKKAAIALSALLIIGEFMLSGCNKATNAAPSDDISDNNLSNENISSPDNTADGKTDASDGESDDKSEEKTESDNSVGPSVDEKLNIALSLIGENVGTLYDAIGEPADSSYASSCMGKGKDGELYYDGFTVCTYLEDGVETVVDAYK